MKKRDVSDVEECLYKILDLLKEYNCKIEIDEELGGDCIIVDKDTCKFEYLARAKAI